ncbi:helix-turn-helix transcriptional regulator [Actinoplanes bogorensis]|uniref:Helix-turn-helix transcriptional regulator n=1 Tax=Paractinoplanes bogorensis TaxID=1610840 RepID=A0ABS5Z465_9ACTN|nr:helix-turn-helix domain-containing protein [Actinoplanes bogorensis]MBU2670475.1 helix-turn-helix transcriptional regulator [Actinoplanes bogorensis]
MPEPDEICGVNIAFAVVGSKWKPTILWVLAGRPHRFAELRRAVGGISEKVLAAQLRELERDGVVCREAGAGFPLNVRYSLTPAGVTLDRLLEPLAEWGHQLQRGR